MSLTLDIMRAMWPQGDQHVAGLVEGIATSAPLVFPKYGLDSDLLVAHALAQFSEECGAGLEMEENMNYTAERLLQVFPTHFTYSLAQKAQHNPRMIADIAYGGRMGNAPPPSDDGFNFRGRGLSQVTGKGVHTPPTPNEGYAALAAKTGLDLLSNPAYLSDPHYTLECGVADFILCGCLLPARADDVVGVTRHLNGGLNGLAAREQWLVKWKRALAVS